MYRSQTSPKSLSSWLLYASLSVICGLSVGISSLIDKPRADAQAAFRDPRIQEALKELESEPSIQEVHRAALRFYNAEPDTVASLRTRANLKHLLPDVNVRYRQSNNGVFIDRLDYLQGEITKG